jgi:translation initiation factor IF-1
MDNPLNLIPAIPGEDWQVGKITEVLPRGLYRVRLEDGCEITAHRAGAARLSHARLAPSTPIWVVLAVNDPTRGRIVARRQ